MQLIRIKPQGFLHNHVKLGSVRHPLRVFCLNHTIIQVLFVGAAPLCWSSPAGEDSPYKSCMQLKAAGPELWKPFWSEPRNAHNKKRWGPGPQAFINYGSRFKAVSCNTVT